MIEKMDVLQEVKGEGLDGSTFTTRFSVGAKPLREQIDDEDAFGDLASVDESIRVRIHRTPNTEEHATPASFVNWRGERWHVQTRIETPFRAFYDLVLERAQT